MHDIDPYLCIYNPKLISVVLLSSAPWDSRRTVILATAMPCIAAFSLCLLLFVEYNRYIRPSSLAILYLLASLLWSAIQLIISRNEPAIGENPGITSCRISPVLVLLTSECHSKESIIKPSSKVGPGRIFGDLESDAVLVDKSSTPKWKQNHPLSRRLTTNWYDAVRWGLVSAGVRSSHGRKKAAR